VADKHIGRPLGSGAGHHISVAPLNRGSVRLTIGKELWRSCGSPRRVELQRRGMALHITPVDLSTMDPDDPIGYAVSGGSTLTAPRISIGKRVAADEYGLEERVYENVHVRRGEIVVFL